MLVNQHIIIGGGFLRRPSVGLVSRDQIAAAAAAATAAAAAAATAAWTLNN